MIFSKHIIILALGSRGDIQPYATLGQGVQTAGCQVRFITFENFAPLIAPSGLDFHPIRGDAQVLVARARANMLSLARSFGSMPLHQPTKTTAVILESLRQTGQRAILQAGWGGLGQSELPTEVFQLDYAPYGWLFPRMTMVIHHGGSGTTAFGLRAGVPSLVVPFVFDQFYWGERIAALGVGPPPIRYRALSVERLKEAILLGTTDTQIRQKAAELGDRIRAEKGLEQAVNLISQISR